MVTAATARRTVWTDFGGVLTPPVRHTLERFCRLVDIAPGTLLDAMRAVGDRFGTDMMAPLDTPLVGQDEWCRLVEQAVLVSSGQVVDLSGFADRWFADREVNDLWLAELRRAKADGCRLGLLSNMPPGWDAHWRRMVPPDGLFDHVVLSFEAGHRKPDPAIFELAARRAGVPPGDCVLVDDLPANCAGAAEAGWHAIHFTATAQAAADLRRWVQAQGTRHRRGRNDDANQGTEHGAGPGEGA